MADDVLLEDGKGIHVAQTSLAALAPEKEGYSTFLNRWRDYLLTPVDGASLAIFRICFGLLMFSDVCRYWIYGWITSDMVEPTFHFTYFLFPFVRPWPGDGMYWHFGALGLLALLMSVGLFYRLAAGGFFVGFTYVFLLDETYYLNHNYLICLLSFLMAIVPAQSAWSLDAWRRRKEAGSPTSQSSPFYDRTVPLWSVLLLRTQVSLVYFYAGIAKLNYDWLVRDEALLFWLKARANWPIVAPLLATPVLVSLMTYGSTVYDLLVGFLLWGRRTFWPAAAVTVFFQMFNSYLFPIGVFPWLMLATLTLFPNPGWPRRWFPKTAPTTQAHAPRLASVRLNAVLVLLHIYLIVQLVMPWRHWLYPGNVSWTEQGHRFSWHMMLRHKDIAKFAMSVTNPQTGTRREIDPLNYLSPRQVRQMSYRPDMILQFAHHVAELEQESTGVRPVVNVRVLASLNARPFQELIDPTVDLAAQPVSLAPAHWIVPLRPVW
jgi:vitamin K-dependent gamma-carboxylase